MYLIHVSAITMNIYELLATFNDMFGGAEITEFAIMVAMGPEKMKDGVELSAYLSPVLLSDVTLHKNKSTNSSSNFIKFAQQKMVR